MVKSKEQTPVTHPTLAYTRVFQHVVEETLLRTAKDGQSHFVEVRAERPLPGIMTPPARLNFDALNQQIEAIVNAKRPRYRDGIVIGTAMDSATLHVGDEVTSLNVRGVIDDNPIRGFYKWTHDEEGTIKAYKYTYTGDNELLQRFGINMEGGTYDLVEAFGEDFSSYDLYFSEVEVLNHYLNQFATALVNKTARRLVK